MQAGWLRTHGTPRPGSWFTRRGEAGGGALLDLGWHLADVALGLLGYPHPRSVTAQLTPLSMAPSGGLGPALWRGDATVSAGDVEASRPDVDGDGSLVASFAGGSSLALRAAWVSDTPVDTTRFIIEVGAHRLELTTTFGFSPHRVTEPVLSVSRSRGTERIALVAEIGQEYDAQLDAVAEFVAGKLDWKTELGESAAVLALLDQAYRVAGRPLVPVDKPAR